jgi:hypothetical protein
MPPAARRCFRLGAVLAAAVALLHAAMPFAPPGAYAYFGAPDLAAAAATGARWPDVLTLGLAAVFAGWSYYALGALGAVRRPPLLRWGLAAVGGVCLLRGVAIVPEGLALARGGGPLRPVVFSAVALALGVSYALGTWRAWPLLRRRPAG